MTLHFRTPAFCLTILAMSCAVFVSVEPAVRAQAEVEARIMPWATELAGSEALPASQPESEVMEWRLVLNVVLIDKRDPPDPGLPNELAQYLSNPAHYEFEPGFRMTEPPKVIVTPKARGGEVQHRIDVIFTGRAEREEGKITLPDLASAPCTLKYDEGDHVKYDLTEYKEYQSKPSTDISLSHGDDVARLNAAMEGVVGNSGNGFLTWDLNVRIPLEKPDDVGSVPGADRDASREVADMVSFSAQDVRYARGGSLMRSGAKIRMTGTGQGFEGVLFHDRILLWFDDMRGFSGAAIELGYREGDAEWVNTTTRAPDRGNVIARLGAVAEWAPQIGGINRRLDKGLRFYVRGRGWLDTFDNQSGDYGVRLRHFVDAELFYNISDEYRAFVRAEHGYLPPDLTQGVDLNVYGGFGAAW